MKIKLSLLIMIALQIFSGAFLAQTSEPASPLPGGSIRVTSDRGGFSVNFPYEPEIEKFVSYGGGFQTPNERYGFRQNGIGLEVFMFVARGGYDIKGAKKYYIDEIIKTLGSSAKIESNQPIKMGRCEALEISATTAIGGFVKRRIFSSGQRIFTLTVQGNPALTGAEEAVRRFLESFVISDDCQAPEIPAEKQSKDEKISPVKGVEEKGSDWRRVSLGSDGVSVLFPSLIKLTEQTLQTFPFPLTSRVYTANERRAYFTVTVFGDYPEDLLATEEARVSMIESMEKLYVVRGLQKQFPDVRFLQKMRLNGFPARRYSFFESGNVIGQLIILVTPHNTYRFVALRHLRNNDNSGNADEMSITKFISGVR